MRAFSAIPPISRTATLLGGASQSGYLLLETADFFLLETGDKILLG